MYILEIGTGLQYPPRTHRETLVAAESAAKLYDYAADDIKMTLLFEQPIGAGGWQFRGDETYIKLTTQPPDALLPKVTWFIIREITVL